MNVTPPPHIPQPASPIFRKLVDGRGDDVGFVSVVEGLAARAVDKGLKLFLNTAVTRVRVCVCVHVCVCVCVCTCVHGGVGVGWGMGAVRAFAWRLFKCESVRVRIGVGRCGHRGRVFGRLAVTDEHGTQTCGWQLGRTPSLPSPLCPPPPTHIRSGLAIVCFVNGMNYPNPPRHTQVDRLPPYPARSYRNASSSNSSGSSSSSSTAPEAEGPPPKYQLTLYTTSGRVGAGWPCVFRGAWSCRALVCVCVCVKEHKENITRCVCVCVGVGVWVGGKGLGLGEWEVGKRLESGGNRIVRWLVN